MIRILLDVGVIVVFWGIAAFVLLRSMHRANTRRSMEAQQAALDLEARERARPSAAWQAEYDDARARLERGE